MVVTIMISSTVLILVLVEHTLGDLGYWMECSILQSLNPCFSGTYSRRQKEEPKNEMHCVLILVLVEHTLGD